MAKYLQRKYYTRIDNEWNAKNDLYKLYYFRALIQGFSRKIGRKTRIYVRFKKW